MAKSQGNLLFLNVCCLGVNQVGVPVASVVAQMCPSVNVTVADVNPEKITLWNTKQIHIREPGLEDILRKKQNRNLVFSTNTKAAIKDADVIFMFFNSPQYWIKKEKSSTDIERAAMLIAGASNKDKILVLKTAIPVGSQELLKRILYSYAQKNVKFQILSIPEFFSPGNAITSLLKPDRVLIGSDQTEEAMKAVETVITIYSQWVPPEKIKTMRSWSAELTKLGQNALLAQKLSNVSALSILCEELGGDITEVIKMIGKCSDIGTEYLESSFGFGDTHLKNDLECLTYMCESLNLHEAADYWRQVLIMNEFRMRKFTKQILFCFLNTMTHKKVAIWGITFKKCLESVRESPAFELCVKLLNEGAKVNVYDPILEKRQFVDELKATGININVNKEGSASTKELEYCHDLYKSAYKADAIVLCMNWNELKDINFESVYRDMSKPAYIFDGWKCLPHEELIKIGFIVKTIGKEFGDVKTPKL